MIMMIMMLKLQPTAQPLRLSAVLLITCAVANGKFVTAAGLNGSLTGEMIFTPILKVPCLLHGCKRRVHESADL